LPDEVGSRSGGSGLLEKNDPLREDFENFVPKGFTTSQIHVLCANFVKFGRPEISKVVRYLPDKKKQKIGLRSRSRFCADRAQNLSGQVQSIYSECPQFHPNPFNSGGVLAERTRERRSNTPQSVSNRPILGEASASSPSNYTTFRMSLDVCLL